MKLSNLVWPRPLTSHLTANLLAAVGATVERAVVSELKDDTFYARIGLRAPQQAVEVDARPSDAIALALYAGAPIYVDEAVMAKAGRELPEEERAVLGEGLQQWRRARGDAP
jgi:bifunctional DNase/RNase